MGLLILGLILFFIFAVITLFVGLAEFRGRFTVGNTTSRGQPGQPTAGLG